MNIGSVQTEPKTNGIWLFLSPDLLLKLISKVPHYCHYMEQMTEEKQYLFTINVSPI